MQFAEKMYVAILSIARFARSKMKQDNEIKYIGLAQVRKQTHYRKFPGMMINMMKRWRSFVMNITGAGAGVHRVLQQE